MSRTITSLVGFIRKLSSMPVDENNLVVYRGHSDRETYTMVPSVFRNARHLSQEKNIYRELVTLHPGEFDGDKTTFDQLVRMQHYSLPTRLLDVTFNPLAALYFAVRSRPLKSAEVIRFTIPKREVKYFDSDTASCLANLANLSAAERNRLRAISDKDVLRTSPTGQRLLHFIMREKPYFLPEIEPNDLKRVLFVKAKQSNRRILAQQGAFLLFGLPTTWETSQLGGISVDRIPIDGKSKKKISGELDEVSINESTLFPEIDVAARYIMSKIPATA